MKFQINSDSEFVVDFPEDAGSILGLDAKCFWGNSERYEYILVSSAFDILSSLENAIVEVLSGVRELSDRGCIGNIGKKYNESNQMFLKQTERSDVKGPQETKYGIWLGNDVLTFIYSYQEVIYIEVSPSYPYFYTDEALIDFPAWMIGFKNLCFTSLAKDDLKDWPRKIDPLLRL